MSNKKLKRTKPVEKPDEIDEMMEEEPTGGIFSSRIVIVLVALASFALILYAVISLASINSQIRERRQELDEIKNEITVQEIKNEEMSRTYQLTEEQRSDYMERIARDDLDYVKEGERVFVNVAGD